MHHLDRHRASQHLFTAAESHPVGTGWPLPSVILLSSRELTGRTRDRA
jgi:hypothetical protein